jgi:GDPmannose 4,6-dehydratase
VKKNACIAGVTGQGGAYRAELLLRKGYEVHGINRRASSFNADSSSLISIIELVQPDETHNLGAMSHVAVRFESPDCTADAARTDTLRILEATRILGLEKKSCSYRASSSELTTPFYPPSPYGTPTIYASWIGVNFHEAYGMYASNGTLFSHESPLCDRCHQ